MLLIKGVSSKISRGVGATKKRPKNSTIKPLPGRGGNGKKTENSKETPKK